MPQINWTRLIIGGLVAALIMFVTDGFFHEKIVKADWQAIYAALGQRSLNHMEQAWLTLRSLSLAAA